MPSRILGCRIVSESHKARYTFPRLAMTMIRLSRSRRGPTLFMQLMQRRHRRPHDHKPLSQGTAWPLCSIPICGDRTRVAAGGARSQAIRTGSSATRRQARRLFSISSWISGNSSGEGVAATLVLTRDLFVEACRRPDHSRAGVAV
jgi:hypothetical protein